MNNIMKSYQDLVDCMPKFSIHEMEKLLKNHDDISKDLFIKSFLRYVFSITYKLYKLHQNELNGFYDFEDFFADAVLCATKLYNSGKYAEYKDAKCSNFNNFVNNFRYLVGSLIARTYPVVCSYEYLYQVKRIRKSLLLLL